MDSIFALFHRIPLKKVVEGVSLLAICAASFFSINYSQERINSTFHLRAGNVSTLDITAPATLTYVSEISTQSARQEAENRVTPVYLPTDQTITRAQVEKLRSALNFIHAVKSDPFTVNSQKITDIRQLNDLALEPAMVDTILSLSSAQWESIRRESLSVLEQSLRSSVRQRDIPGVRARMSTLVTLDLTSEQGALIAAMASPFVAANSIYSAEDTLEARQIARSSVEPVTETFVQGQIIVRKGQLITPHIEEALLQYNLGQPQGSQLEDVAVGALIFVLVSFTALYINRRRLEIGDNLRGQLLIAFNFLLFLISSRLVVHENSVIPYLFPLQAFGLTIAALFQMELSLILSMVLGILAAYGLPASLDLTVYYLLTSAVGILALSKATRIAHFFRAGLAIGLSGIITILAYRLGSPGQDFIQLLSYSVAALVAGIASASLALLLQYIFSQLIGLTTPLQLLEISRSDHPLLQLLLRQAPGSYQHALQVSVLAEHAAERIGADALLTRVGSLFHDVGKASNPSFFIENQPSDNLDAHDDLDPVEAARTIIRHVPDGIALAKKYNLPKRMLDFIQEHHGTTVTRYLYGKALEKAKESGSEVDISQFTYQGPIPQSRETAILMLADVTQARMRAQLPRTEADIEHLINDVIQFAQNNQQLDAARITMKDLSDITQSFLDTLKNTYHPRIQYPDVDPAKETRPA